MSLSVTVNPSVSLPDLAQIEARAKNKLAELDMNIQAVQGHFSDRLKQLRVSDEDVARLHSASPKLLDANLRGSLNTVSRYQREKAQWASAVDALKAVQARVDAGETASMFEVQLRGWGRTRTRVYVKIVDSNLLLLHQLGLL